MHNAFRKPITRATLVLRHIVRRHHELRQQERRSHRAAQTHLSREAREALKRAALYAGPDLRKLLEEVREEVRAARLDEGMLTSVEDVAQEVALELEQREGLLSVAVEELREETLKRKRTGKELPSYWYCARDETEKRTSLLSTACKAAHVAAELQRLLALAHVTPAATISPNHND